MHRYSYPRLYARKVGGNNDRLIEWFLENLPFIKNDSIWLILFEGMGVWWIKVKVDDCKKALSELWKLGEICVVDTDSQAIFYIGANEANYEIALKRL